MVGGLKFLRRLFAEGAPLRFEITTTNSIEARRLAAAGQVDVAMISTDRPAGPEETRLCRQRFFWIAPRLAGKGQWLVCRTDQLVTAGDHVIIIGLVVHADTHSFEPLLYRQRAFGTVTHMRS